MQLSLTSSSNVCLLHCDDMMPDYVTVYQIAQDPQYRSSSLLIFAVRIALQGLGLIPLIAGITLLLGRKLFDWRVHWGASSLLCCLGAIWLLAWGRPRMDSKDLEALSAFQRGDYQIVEGRVTKFDPMPVEGHKNECFSLQNQRFCYSDYMIAPGFRNAASHGGPIREGLQVRIAHRGSIILRIESAKEPAVSTP